ncbi:drug resistance transporter EmrB/QacA subfamily [Thozetella sp. PMI_491]|nr:drug resistance transporter EmrB/QacA subfamily [Thozetella sp. PMI_491]
MSETPPVWPKRDWRFYLLTLGIWVALFLSTLETTIVSTSLVSITNALSGFILRDWIVTAYLLTYTGFLTIYAKISDVFGRKTIFLLAIAIFTIFSILCGTSTGIVQLIVFRAFQGVGASGMYSMVMVVAPDLVPPEEYGKFMGIISSVFVLASILGPILGGVISTHSVWQWVFLLNAPGGAMAFTLIAFFLPMSEASSKLSFSQRLYSKFSRSTLARVDALGMFLLLASSILLVFALEQGGTRYPWNSAAVISTLVIAIMLGIAFVLWEMYIDQPSTVVEPVFPPHLLKNRFLAAMLANTFFVGFSFVAIVVNVPQRAQAVAGLSPVDAGLALLPLLLTSPFATALSAYLTTNMKVPPFYLILFSAVLQLLGVGLMCSLPTETTSVPAAQYGFEVLMGIGFGMGLTTVLTFARIVVTKKDTAVMMGALTQVRVLSGTISLAICATILNNHLSPQLLSIVTPAQAQKISESLATINDLTPDQQVAVKHLFSEGYGKQNIFLTALTAIAFITAVCLWERHPRKGI